MTPHEVQEACERQTTVDLRFALAAFGIGEATGYRMAKYCPAELPFKVLKVGRIYKVPTTSLRAALDIPAGSSEQLTAC